MIALPLRVLARRTTTFVVLSVVLLGVLLPGRAAYACSCMQIDPAVRLQEVEAAFVGALQDVRPGSDTTRFTYEVEAVMAGELAPTVVVNANVDDGANCGLRAEPGERVGLFLYGTPAGWSSSSCDTVDADALLAVGEPREPDAALATPDGEPAGSSTSPWLALVAAVGGAGLVLGAALWWGRRSPAP